MKPSVPRTFAQWRQELNSLLQGKVGLTLKDFPLLDDDFNDAFAEGVAPDAYFDETIRGELEDWGFNPKVSGEGSSAGKDEYENAHAHAHAHEKEKEKEREEDKEKGSRRRTGERDEALDARRWTHNARNEPEGAFERSELAFGFDLLGALDSDDIEWLQQEEARRAKEARSCPHCGTRFHPVSPYAEECPSITRHERRCAKASSAEREFYAEHRRWPRRRQVEAAQLDSDAEEAA